jgi:hypothetical protein
MWSFVRRPSVSLDRAMEDSVAFAAAAWIVFRNSAGVPANIHLRDQVAFFAPEFVVKLARRFPALRSAPNDLILLIIAQGIEASGSISRRKIELQLGIILPPT